MKTGRWTIAAACIVFSACRSPEATRARGSGPGADTGNRPSIVSIHEGSRQYWQTPVSVPGELMPLAPARHAQQWSER
jgi:hypothetical protein